MKFTNGIARVAATLMSLLVFASAGFAATKPILSPSGLALDAKGNLYVANTGGSNILVYNPNYVQLTGKTISQGVADPSAVAFDSLGNLWIANLVPSNGGALGSVAQYNVSTGQQTGVVITQNIWNPGYMAVDGLDNVWVTNNGSYLTVYGSILAYAPPTLLQTFPVNPPEHGIAITGAEVALGGPLGTYIFAADPALAIQTEGDGGGVALNGAAVASAAGHTFYVADSNGTVVLYTSTGVGTGNSTPFVTLPFVPSGMVVDNVRGRVYISDGAPGASIYVYSTAGVLLHTIQ